MTTTTQFSINDNIYNQEQLIAWCHEAVTDQATEEWKKDIANFIIKWFDNKETISVNSSGTTGKSKELKLSKKAMAASAKVTNAFFKLNNESSALLCIPAKYIGGKMMLVRMLVSHMNLWLIKPTSNPLANFSRKVIDFCPMIPLQVEQSINSHAADFKNIKNVIIGGAPVSYGLEEKLKVLDNNIYATFGMTETVSHVALRKISGENASDHYKALDGIRFEINEDIKFESCVVIQAPHLQDEPFYTNDIVTLIDEHTFIWKGRKDNMINSGGLKFNPEELESMVHHLIPNHQYFFAGIKDQRLGQKIVLFIESEIPIPDIEGLSNKLTDVLPQFGNPKQIFTRPLFLKTETGKIKRNETVIKWHDHSARSNDSL